MQHAARGSGQHTAILTTQQCQNVRSLYRWRKNRMPAIAKMMGVTTTTIWKVIHRMPPYDKWRRR